MISPYLKRPLRSLEEIQSRNDDDPILVALGAARDRKISYRASVEPQPGATGDSAAGRVSDR